MTMSSCARLARKIYCAKPAGLPYDSYPVEQHHIASVSDLLGEAVQDCCYSAAVSYCEAIAGLTKGSVAWSIVKLYYTCFYSIKTLLLAHRIVPFHSGKEMLLSLNDAKFLSGGSNSHVMNWKSIRSIGSLYGAWFVSQDSETAYNFARINREKANYTEGFTDPKFSECIGFHEEDIARRYRTYRDDESFLYTYLPDHLQIAYPTKLLMHAEVEFKSSGASLSSDKQAHLKKIWPVKDRCPMTFGL